jgi:C4-dicarboxylate transporter, DctM subunit
MAGAAPTAKPAPFLRPLDRLDRGVLLAESSLSLVIVVFMLFAAVSESAFRVIQNWPGYARVGLCAAIWLLLVGLKLSGAPSEPAPAEGLIKRLRGVDLPRSEAVRQAIGMFAPLAIVLGAATEWLMRAVLPFASDVLLHGTIWAAFLGASFATRGRKHLAIDALSRLLPDRGRRLVVGVSATMGAFVAFALAQGVYGCLQEASHQVIRTLEENHRNGVSSPIDQSFEFQYVIPAGFLFIGLRLALHGFHEFVAGLANYKAPPVTANVGDPVAAAHEGSIEEPKIAPAVDRADATEIGIAIAALLGVVGICAGSTIVKPVAGMCLLAAITLVVPLINRKRSTGSYAAPVADPYEPVQGAPQHFVIAAVLVLSILAVMRFGLAPHIATIPISVGIAFFAVMALLGAPLFSFLGGMGLFLFVKFFLVDPDVSRHANAFNNSVEDILGNHFARMSVLATIPLFTLAGYIMSESRMPQRLVRVSRALLGWMPGGLAIVCVFASAFFTIFSGASGITIVAVGGLLVPALLRDKYPEKFSLGLVTAGGALGITVPPCLPLIVYGIVAGLQEPAPGQERLELQKFLVVGLVPGLVAIGIVVIYCVIVGVVAKVPRSRFDWAEARAALWEAKWELILPVFLLAGLVKGIFNPSQAAAFTAFYVVVMEVFVYRDLTIRDDLPRIIPESMVLVGAIFVKLCAATVLVGYFVQAQIADRLFEWLTCGPPALAYMHAHADSIGTCREAVDILGQTGQSAGGLIDSKLSFLIALNFFLLLIGMLMDIFSAIVVVVPLIAGIALHFHINPYHLGIVFLMNLEIGYLMPPMGLNLFIAGFRFNRPVPDLYKMVLPFIALFIGALMIVTYVPALTTFTVPSPTAATAPLAAPTGPATTGVTPQPGAAALPPPGNCDTPGDDESFDDFMRRCSPAEGDAGAPAEGDDAGTPAMESPSESDAAVAAD